MAPLVIRLLGTFRVERDGATIPLGLSHARLLAALCLAPEPISRTALAGSVLHLARATVDPQLTRLANALGIDRVHEVSAPRSGRIRLAAGIAEVDAVTYRALAHDALAVDTTTSPGPAPTLRAHHDEPGHHDHGRHDVLELLLAADDRWTGPVDAGLDLADGDHPVALAIADLDALRARQRAAARSHLLGSGRPDVVVRLERWAREAPHDPTNWSSLVDVALERGDLDGATRWLDTWDATLTHHGAANDRQATEVASARARVRAERMLPAAVGDVDGPRAGDHEPVAREAAVARLDQLLDDMARRRGGMVAVAGRAGTGKSLLLDRITADAAARGFAVNRVDLENLSSLQVAWSRALGPRWREALADERARPRLVGLVEGVETLFGWRAPEGDEPADVASTVARLAAELLRVTGHGRPLLLVFDDLHRADPVLDLTLARLEPALRSTGCGVVVSFRPEQMGERDRATLIELGPLDEDGAVSLLREVRGLDLSPAEYRRAHALTGGVPLELMSLDVADLAPPTVALPRHDGDPPADGVEPGEDDRPDVLRDRFARLDDRTRYALGLAALASHGTDVDVGLVEDLARGDRAVLDALGRELERGEIATGAEGRARFVHRRWQEVAYDELGPEVPPLAHGEAFAHLRRRGAGSGSVAEHAAALAHHASRSARSPIDRAAAVLHLIESADRFAGSWEYGLSMTLYGTALDLANADERYDILVARARCARLAARWDEAERDLAEAADWAAYRNDAPREAEALMAAAQVTWDPHRLDGALAARLRNVLDRLGPDLVTLRWRVASCLGGGLYQDGSSALTDELAPIVGEATRRATLVRSPQQRAEMLMWARKALLGHIPPRESLALSRQLARAAGTSTFLEANALLAAIVDLVRLGRLGPARRVTDRYRALSDRTGSPVHAYVTATLDALWALADGDWEEAEASVGRAGRFGEFGGATSIQVVYGQRLWLDRERGALDGEPGLAAQVAVLLPADGAIPLWSTVAAWLHAIAGALDAAETALADVAEATDGFCAVAPGAMRIGLLSLAAETVGLITAGRGVGGEPTRWAHAIGTALAAEPDRCVLLGWPTVVLGPRLRYEGLAAAATGAADRADALLEAAAGSGSCTAAFTARIATERDGLRRSVGHQVSASTPRPGPG